MNKIYFTADLHIGHTNILKHQPDRPFATDEDSSRHDEYIIDLWSAARNCRFSYPRWSHM